MTLAAGAVLSLVWTWGTAIQPARAADPAPVGGLVGTVDQTVRGTLDHTTHGTVDDIVRGTLDGTLPNTVDHTVRSVVHEPTAAITRTVRHITRAAGAGATTATGTVSQAVGQRRHVAETRPAVPAAPVTARDHSDNTAPAQRTTRSTPGRSTMHRPQGRATQRSGAPTRANRRTPTGVSPRQRAVEVTAAQRQVVAATRPRADAPCRSASLAEADLRRCARADIALPDLGGPQALLLPIGVVLLGAGLAFVVRSRRRAAWANG